MQMIDHYPVTFRRTGKPGEPAEVAAAEKLLKVSFPTAYAEFLMEHNGGSPSPAYLPQEVKVERFFSLADHELVDTCLLQRETNGLAQDCLSIAEIGKSSLLVLDCSKKNSGQLMSWIDVSEGFRRNDREFENVSVLYFGMDELFRKLGPARNREDRDGMFFRLYYASGSPAHGGRLAAQFVAAGYDINFVVPPYRHPIFAAIDSEAWGVAESLLALGTSKTIRDSTNDNATIADRLQIQLDHWAGLLEVTTQNDYETGQNMSKRRIEKIQSLMKVLSGR